MQTKTNLGAAKKQLELLFEELLAHDGFGELRLEVRILKRGQKEIILHCGKQYRYVVDFYPINHGSNTDDTKT